MKQDVETELSDKDAELSDKDAKKEAREQHEIERRSSTWHKASEKYLDSYHEIDIKQKKNKLAFFAKITKGLLSISDNHAATEAIISGVKDSEKSKAIWKMVYWGVVPMLIFYLTTFFITLTMLGDELQSVGTLLVGGISTVAIILLVLAPLTWLSIIGHSWCTHYISRGMFKSKNELIDLSLMIGVWVLLFNYLFIVTQIIVFLILMSFGSFAIMAGVVTLTVMTTLIIGYHRSIAYTLGISGFKSFMITVFLIGVLVISYLVAIQFLDPATVAQIESFLLR